MLEEELCFPRVFKWPELREGVGICAYCTTARENVCKRGKTRVCEGCKRSVLFRDPRKTVS